MLGTTIAVAQAPWKRLSSQGAWYCLGKVCPLHTTQVGCLSFLPLSSLLMCLLGMLDFCTQTLNVATAMLKHREVS